LLCFFSVCFGTHVVMWLLLLLQLLLTATVVINYAIDSLRSSTISPSSLKSGLTRTGHWGCPCELCAKGGSPPWFAVGRRDRAKRLDSTSGAKVGVTQSISGTLILWTHRLSRHHCFRHRGPASPAPAMIFFGPNGTDAKVGRVVRPRGLAQLPPWLRCIHT
jgi:hypothetical protein